MRVVSFTSPSITCLDSSHPSGTPDQKFVKPTVGQSHPARQNRLDSLIVAKAVIAVVRSESGFVVGVKSTSSGRSFLYEVYLR